MMMLLLVIPSIFAFAFVVLAAKALMVKWHWLCDWRDTKATERQCARCGRRQRIVGYRSPTLHGNVDDSGYMIPIYEDEVINESGQYY